MAGLAVVTWTLGITDPAQIMARVTALGITCIQYAGDHRDCRGIELREQAAKAGVRVLAVDPFNAGPSNPSLATEEAAIDYYKSVVNFAVEAGVNAVTLQGLSQWTRNCPDSSIARQRLLVCSKAVDAYARSQGVKTLYEVCNHYEVPLIHTAAECHKLIQEVGGDNMRMILDSFHMNINEQDPLSTLQEYGMFTAIYHLSDSGRGGIGSGHIDFELHYRALLGGGFAGNVAMEFVLPHLTPSNAPAHPEDNERLDVEIRRSALAWRALVGGTVGAMKT